MVTILFSLSSAVGFNVRVISSGLLFTIVPIHSRSSIVGVRQVVFKMSLCVGFFSSAFMFNTGQVSYPILAIICLTMSVIRLFRSPTFLKKYA